MGSLIGFVVRLVGYALLIGIPVRFAEYLWERAGLDQVSALRAPHDLAITIATYAPVVLALFGFGALRRPAIFVAGYIVGVALTASFAFARLAPTG
jgi:hypothetical protein